MIDELLVETPTIGQDHDSDCAPVSIGILHLHGDIFAERLTLLRAVNSVEPDFLCPAIMHDFDRIAIGNTNDATGEVGECQGWENEDQKKATYVSLKAYQSVAMVSAISWEVYLAARIVKESIFIGRNRDSIWIRDRNI